ncbi:MAG TPA: hypothetical protein VLF66_00005, partial [Thermoanaerobaculia bacterium]|nr:hypothetical protein [Thermoanaerobaculia bacterium]
MKGLLFLSIVAGLLTCPPQSSASMADDVTGCDRIVEEHAALGEAVVSFNAHAVPRLLMEWRRLRSMHANGAGVSGQPRSGTDLAPDGLSRLWALLEPPPVSADMYGAQLFNLAETFWGNLLDQEGALGLGAAFADGGFEVTPAPLSVRVEGDLAEIRNLVFDTLYAAVAP